MTEKEIIDCGWIAYNDVFMLDVYTLLANNKNMIILNEEQEVIMECKIHNGEDLLVQMDWLGIKKKLS